MKNKKTKLRNIEYEIIRNDDDCYNQEIVESRINETDYFDNYDYIVGDYAYEKIRLKGFYDTKNKKKNSINDYANVETYIKEYCQLGSKIFIIKKLK